MRIRTLSSAPAALRSVPMTACAAGLALLGSTLFAGSARASDELVLIPDPTLLLIMVIAFALLVFPLNALLFKPIFKALDARRDRIQGAQNRSAQLQREADSVLERYETAIREARVESEARRQSMLEDARQEQVTMTATARQEMESELEHARGELERAVVSARETLRSNAEELAQAAAEQVLGRTLS